jgi:heme-degrading monooxygenase HmoA
MVYLVLRHTVADYGKWKRVFDEDGATRKAAGAMGGMLFRNADKPNEIVILLEWDSKENARKYTQSPDLHQKMERAGVIGIPEVYFLDKAEDLTR